jgi:hypothetical protein
VLWLARVTVECRRDLAAVPEQIGCCAGNRLAAATRYIARLHRRDLPHELDDLARDSFALVVRRHQRLAGAVEVRNRDLSLLFEHGDELGQVFADVPSDLAINIAPRMTRALDPCAQDRRPPLSVVERPLELRSLRRAHATALSLDQLRSRLSARHACRALLGLELVDATLRVATLRDKLSQSNRSVAVGHAPECTTTTGPDRSSSPSA